MDWTVGFKFFAAMFAIMNPLTTLPVFLAMTGGQPPESSRRTALTMIATVTVGSVICALVGRLLLNVFGIDIPHFRLAGGLIVLLIALTMLNGEDHPSHAGTPEEKAKFPAASSIGVYPLGIPIAFGPGTMATVIVFAQTSAEAGAMGVYAITLALYLVFFGIAMLAAPLISHWMSPMTLSLTRRLMGLVLAAIAMEMIVGSLGKLFPAWLG